MARSTPEWIGKRPESMPIKLVEYRTRARNTALTIDYFLSAAMPEPNSGCWIWLKAYSKRNGYGAMRDGGKSHRAHRRSYEVANSCKVPRHLDVCHRCDNRLCVNPDHLFVGTRAENMADCARKGRNYKPDLRGEQLTQSKLTTSEVRAIRLDNRSQRQVAKAYGIDRSTVGAIRRRKTWGHVV